MRVVLDTNIFISGLLLPNSIPGRVLQAWHEGDYDLLVSAPMLAEIEAVLAYPKIKKRLQWDAQTISTFIASLQFLAESVDIRGANLSVPDDPDDAIILATFVVGQADYLVTGDDDLLVLSEKYKIVSPAEFMEFFW